MEWFFGQVAALWGLICSWSKKKRGIYFKVKKKSIWATNRKPKQRAFYSQIPAAQISLYQSYIDRAFKLSPSLEFKQNDLRFHRLLAEAAQNDDLNEIDLELMRIQYVLADKALRDVYRPSWVVKVINRDENDFFPSPWAILSSLFTGQRQDITLNHTSTVH